MRTLLTIAATSILILTPNLATAQAPAPGVETAQTEQTATGCLSRGSGDSYVLEVSDGTKISVTGPAQLAEHIGHIVRLKGTFDQSGRSFKATAVDSIASSCTG